MSHEFSKFIKIIGAGKRAGRSLNAEEAFDAMSLLLAGKTSAEQKGAFLMLLRVREESIDELVGFTRACRLFVNSKLNNDTKIDIDVPCYAGKRRQLPWYILALALMHQQGYSILMHGTTEPESKRLYIKEVFSQLGILSKLQVSTGEALHSKIAKNGVAYADLADINTELDRIIQLREQFSLRSCANTLARLLNPYQSEFSIQGVHHFGIDHKHASVACEIGEENILCFRGEGGEPEINPAKDTELKYVKNGQVRNELLNARQKWQIKPRELNVQLISQVWSGELSDDYAMHTIIATLQAYLCMTKSLTLSDAEEIAQSWWQNRNTTHLFGIDLLSNNSLFLVNSS